MAHPFNKLERIIIIMLRMMGIGGLLAIPAIFLPYSWMNTCHELIGLGELPNEPIVTYLARSLSAFYAIIGTFLLFISCDIRRYRALIKLWAIIAVVMGLVLFGIDLSSGLPTSWVLFEGPMTVVVGFFLLWSQRQIGRDVDEPPTR